MDQMKSLAAMLCVCLTIAPLSEAQFKDPMLSGLSGPVVRPPERKGFFKDLVRQYRQWDIAPISLENSNRLENLLRAGRIYLSLDDAIALALENNLDIAVQRYTPLQAQADLLRAEAGGLLRGVPSAVQNGPSNAGGNFLLGAGPATNSIVSNTGTVTNTTNTGATGVNGVITQIGPTTPNYDPILTGTVSWGHQTSPQTNLFSYGTNALVQTNKLANFAVQQGFSTGGSATLSYNNLNTFANTGRFDVNPYTTSSLDLVLAQPLLQGFGFAVNKRQITVARNNLKVADSTFKLQVITTVANVISLYWNLVSLNAQVQVARQSLSVSEKLYNDNKIQVRYGTLAPIEIVRAEAEVAANQQNLTIADTNVLEQETILKNVLSRNGVASPSLAEARIVTTDSISMPEVEAIQPIQDLVNQALGQRPELESSRLNLQNSQTQLIGSKNGLLPTLTAFADLTNHAQAGSINTLPVLNAQGQPTGIVRQPGSVDQFFVGGYSTVLGQLFGRNFPDYRVGVNLNIPLRNRSAEADYIRDRLNLRQSQLNLQQQINQIRVDVQNGLIALQQARARYQAATKQRILEEQTLDAEQKKYALGASTIYLVIQTERDLATAQSSEVTALAQYSQARVNLDQATGDVLTSHNINLSEAKLGVVSRPPAPLPVLEGGGGSKR